MPDVTDALERLVALRDRGVLTEEEFNSQKSQLLARAAPGVPTTTSYPTAATPAGTSSSNKTLLIALGGLVLAILVVGGLWVSGAFSKGTTKQIFGGASAPIGATPPTTTVSSMAAPSTIPSPLPVTAAPSDGNPLIGSWASDNPADQRCEPAVSITANEIDTTVVENGVPSVRKRPALFKVENPMTVRVFDPNDPNDNNDISIELVVRDGHLIMSQACSYHRA